MPTPPVEAGIDRLYSLPLEEFVSARNELAKQHRGEDGKAIRALQKPSVVAWGLNQVYWTARPVFDRLVAAAAGLREAQARGLQGKGGDLRGAGAAHREALVAAVKAAAAILERAGHDAGPDALRALTAAFEALPWEEPAGRLVRPPEPSGFAIFAGMSFAEAPSREAPAPRGEQPAAPRPEAERPAKRARGGETAGRAEKPERRSQGEREEREQEERAREQREREARHRETVAAARGEAEAAAERARAAQGQLARAREEELAARERLEDARRAVKEAEAALREADRATATAQAALRVTVGSSAPPTGRS